jgi:hypothetical protein
MFMNNLLSFCFLHGCNVLALRFAFLEKPASGVAVGAENGRLPTNVSSGVTIFVLQDSEQITSHKSTTVHLE